MKQMLGCADNMFIACQQCGVCVKARIICNMSVRACHCLSTLTAESSASKAQQELERLQQQVATATQQLEAAKETAKQRKTAEKETEGQLEDAKSQLQVSLCSGGGAFSAEQVAHTSLH